jgi:carbonic anhydrase
MSLIDKAVTANREYAKNPDPKLADRPRPRLAVVTCMDPRLSDLPAILGLPHAELDVIRTAGLRSARRLPVLRMKSPQSPR